jgi:hypothetical protein
MEYKMKGPIVEELPATPQSITSIPSIPSPDPAAAPTKEMPERLRIAVALELTKASAIDETIEIWFAKHFHNLGALLDERMHNIIHAAKEDLKAELAKLSSSL